MRIINIVTIKNKVINDIESFAVLNEENVNLINKKAEECFIQKIKENGFLHNTEPYEYETEADEIGDILDNGYFLFDNGSVCLSWSWSEDFQKQQENKKIDVLVCQQCGGQNIQVEAWVDANTNEYIYEHGDDTWCNDCEENDLGIIYMADYEPQEEDEDNE